MVRPRTYLRVMIPQYSQRFTRPVHGSAVRCTGRLDQPIASGFKVLPMAKSTGPTISVMALSVGGGEYGGAMAEVTALARGLLGQILHGHQVSVRITEVEAYGGINDPASHAFSRTRRSEIMYGPPWRLYVYRIHGHHCANVVTGPTEEAAAVLIRAGEVVSGIDTARLRRGHLDDAVLARGPGNLAKSLGITTADLGADLLDASGVHLGERTQVDEIVSGPRVGVRLAADLPFRFWLANEPSVSSYRRHPKAESHPDST